MKDSGVEWIGEIPKDWKVCRIKNIFNRKNLKAKQENPVILSLARSGVKIRDISTNEGQIAESYYNYNPVEPYDLLINPMDLYSGANCSCSKVAGVISPAYINIRAKEEINPFYYDYYLKTQYWAKALFAHGKGISYDNRWTLSVDMFMNYYVPLPTYNEQCKIADFLKEYCGYIDQISNKTRDSINEFLNMKLAMIKQAVTKGIIKNRTLINTNVEWIGSIPEHWKVNRVANLYQEVSEKGNDELPILTVSINNGVSDRELSDEESDRVFVRSEDRSKYKRVRPGDLTYNMMRAWQGAFGAVRVDGMVSPAYVVARPTKKLDSRYVEYLFRTPEAIEEMHRYSYGVADFRLRLYWPQFKNIKMCVPPYEEQVEIADYIDRKKVEIDALIHKKEQYLVELENYKKSLIYEYVTGKKEVPNNE